MTTAHRPTYVPALGGNDKNEGALGRLSKQYSVRDQKAHSKLKFRQPGQGDARDNASKDFKAELEAKEAEHFNKRKADEAGAIADAQEQAEKRLKAIEQLDPDLDADDDAGDESSDESSDDDDDEAELLRELQKIKQERADEAAEREAVKEADAEQTRQDVYMKGNPLLNAQAAAGISGDFSVTRRWDDDVVFKNCAKLEDKEDAGFVNDTLRSEFHRRFMTKYVT
jgi:protein CWC15